MFFKKKGNRLGDKFDIADGYTKDINDVHENLIDKTEILNLEDVSDDAIELDIDFDDEPEYLAVDMQENAGDDAELEDAVLEIDESVELEDVSGTAEISEDSDELELSEESDELELLEDSDELELMEDSDELELSEDSDDFGLTIEDADADEMDGDYLVELDEIGSLDDGDSDTIHFAKRWALVLTMAAASVVIGVSSVAIVTVKNKSAKTVSAEVTTEEPTTERFLLLTEDYKNVEYKDIVLEIVPEETAITVNILNSESQPYTGVLFKAVAVKGTVDDNREFLNEVVTHEEVEDFDTTDSVPFTQVNDDDLDGSITFNNLDEDSYTIALLSSAGYNPVEPVEVSTVKYEIIDNIMEIVYEETPELLEEDPEKDKTVETTTAATTVAATEAATTAPASTEKVQVTQIKTEGSEVVYSSSVSSKTVTEDDVSKYIKDSNKQNFVVENNGVSSSVTGYVYEYTDTTIGGKTYTLPSAILVEKAVNTSSRDWTVFSVMQSASRIVAVDETETTTQQSSGDKANTDSPDKDEKTEDEAKKDLSNTSPSSTDPSKEDTSKTENPSNTEATTTQPATTTAAKKTYVIYYLTPVTETKSVYADGWVYADGGTYYYEDGNPVTGWKMINDMQYYFNSDGIMSSSLVIDVSRYNGNIDWNAVKASGIDYAIIRVGYRGYEYGKIVRDSMFDENMSGAIAAGIKVGAYIVTQAVNTTEAVEEASYIVSACSGYNISLPLVIDVESAGGGAGRGDKISVSTRTAVINAFAQTVRSAGYTPMVYANKSWLEGRINSGSIYSYCNIWLAKYSDTLGYGSRIDMWQFRSDGSVSGVGTAVDVSAWIR